MKTHTLGRPSHAHTQTPEMIANRFCVSPESDVVSAGTQQCLSGEYANIQVTGLLVFSVYLQLKSVTLVTTVNVYHSQMNSFGFVGINVTENLSRSSHVSSLDLKKKKEEESSSFLKET